MGTFTNTKKIVCRNSYGYEIVLSYVFPFFLDSYTGLHEVSGTISTIKSAFGDGATYIGTSVNTRGINLVIAFKDDESLQINKQKIYNIFALKDYGTLYYYEGDIVRKIGYQVENVVLTRKANYVYATINLVCPSPFFTDSEETIATLSNWNKLLTFPLEIPGTEIVDIRETGSDIWIDNSVSARIDSKLKGNTYQYNSDGYNYLPNNFTNQVISGVTFVVNEDGTISANGTATEDISISVSGNSGVPFESQETAIAKGCPSNGSDSTYHVIISKVVGGVISTITTLYGLPDDTNVFIGNAGDEVFYNIVIKQGCVCRELLFKPMISSSSTVIDYEPYTAYEVVPTPDNPKEIKSVTGIQTINVSNGVLSQEVSIDLGNIELNSIGDHIDYIDGTPDNWVLHKNVCSILLDGSENYTYIGRSSSCRKFSFEPTNEKANLVYGARNMLSNNFINIEATDTYSEGIYEQSNDSLIYFRILSTRASSVDNLKTWLSTHNTKILYKLKNEITETITDSTLVEQLNAVYNLESYNDLTTIICSSSSSSNTPFIMDVHITNEGSDNGGIEFGASNDSTTIEIENNSHIPYGLTIIFKANDTVVNPKLSNTYTGETMQIYQTMQLNDKIIVKTYNNQKSITYINAQGTEYNINNKLVFGTDFLQAVNGINRFEPTADSGASNLEVEIDYYNYYEAV